MGRVSVIRAILLGVVLLALPAGAHAQWTEGPYLGSRGNYLADVTGDGMADAIVVNDDRITVRRSAGNRFSGNESWTNEPYYSTKSDKLTFFADVTGDGRADAIVVDDNRVTVRRSTGSGFGRYEGWTEGPYYSFKSDDLMFFADVTGDGRADAIVVDDNRVTVRRSTGSGFSGNENWTNEPYYSTMSDDLMFFADVTGDGRADAIVVDYERVHVRPSTGGGFAR